MEAKVTGSRNKHVLDCGWKQQRWHPVCSYGLYGFKQEFIHFLFSIINCNNNTILGFFFLFLFKCLCLSFSHLTSYQTVLLLSIYHLKPKYFEVNLQTPVGWLLNEKKKKKQQLIVILSNFTVFFLYEALLGEIKNPRFPSTVSLLRKTGKPVYFQHFK